MSEAEKLHRHLIGQQGSRRSLNTPALVLDLEMLDRNIAEMSAFARAHNVKLRPHSKTHKSADIAKRQIAAGALGVCCAKLGEAEALGEAGVQSLHITSPVVTPQAIDRLMALNGQVRSSPTPRTVAVPVAVILKRCSSVPAGARTSSLAGATPPEPTTSRLALPVERTTSVLPTGTATGPCDCIAVVSPGWIPGRITGGLPV